MPSTAWTRDQLLKTLALYCQLPFGKMHRSNPGVIALAAAIGRTPSSVAMRLGNFANCDPFHKARGIKGLSGGSTAVREIWDEYYGRWEELAESAVILPDPLAPIAKPARSPREPKPFSGPTEQVRETKLRRGQDFFRAAVFAAHESKCCITGITHPALLRASHIIPWASSTDAHRVDPRNGLCLNTLHDAAFDRGLITFSEDLTLRISGRLKKQVPGGIYQEMFECHASQPINLPARYRPLDEFLTHHRTKVFQK